MGSMSYCLFENTLGELGRCIDQMSEAESLQELTEQMSVYELRAFHEMWRTCRDFLAEHERLLNSQEIDLANKCYENT